MFHQANLDYINAEEIEINGETQKLSLFQAWLVIKSFYKFFRHPFNLYSPDFEMVIL